MPVTRVLSCVCGHEASGGEASKAGCRATPVRFGRPQVRFPPQPARDLGRELPTPGLFSPESRSGSCAAAEVSVTHTHTHTHRGSRAHLEGFPGFFHSETRRETKTKQNRRRRKERRRKWFVPSTSLHRLLSAVVSVPPCVMTS